MAPSRRHAIRCNDRNSRCSLQSLKNLLQISLQIPKSQSQLTRSQSSSELINGPVNSVLRLSLCCLLLWRGMCQMLLGRLLLQLVQRIAASSKLWHSVSRDRYGTIADACCTTQLLCGNPTHRVVCAVLQLSDGVHNGGHRLPATDDWSTGHRPLVSRPPTIIQIV